MFLDHGQEYNSLKITVNRGGFAQGGVKLHRASKFNIFKSVTANPANCCGLLKGTILYKAHNSSQDFQ
jgi:hypothetical protein